MAGLRQVTSALISVYHKDPLVDVIQKLKELNIKIYSTGGTARFIREQGAEVTAVEDITHYPSILGGRVKTLHPKVFGGILARRDVDADKYQLQQYEIPEIDLVIVDLYPFEKTVKHSTDEDEIIEQIDIGGISLIRAAAKNYRDTLVVPSIHQYDDLLNILSNNDGASSLEERKRMATEAFNISSNYDTAIFRYFDPTNECRVFKQSIQTTRTLRYGENPHQQGTYYGRLSDMFDQLHGKELSYNNLVDIDAAIELIDEFEDTTVAIIKHTNACGLASRDSLAEAWKSALAGDSVSAFGGIVACNRPVDIETAKLVNEIFIEVIIAPSYEADALDILQSKKNRIILQRKQAQMPDVIFKSLLNGVIEQNRDQLTETREGFKLATKKSPHAMELDDMEFAVKSVKHLKSNTISLVKNKQVIGIGTGQTSRVDALKQAIEKANAFGFETKGAVMASDAFFPFPDCVEIAHQAGINAVVQPGGSIRDKDSIAYCDANDMSMMLTGIRHFRH